MRYFDIMPFVTIGGSHSTLISVWETAKAFTFCGGPAIFSSGCVRTSNDSELSPIPWLLFATTRNWYVFPGKSDWMLSSRSSREVVVSFRSLNNGKKCVNMGNISIQQIYMVIQQIFTKFSSIKIYSARFKFNSAHFYFNSEHFKAIQHF